MISRTAKRCFSGKTNLCVKMSPSIWRFDPVGPEGHISRKGFRGPLKAAILDWSGTTADQHVLAPAVVFFDVFKKHGVDITMAEARLPMGLRKDLHIAKIMEIPAVKERWTKIKGSVPTQKDVDDLFKDFVPMQLACLEKYTTLIPGTADTVKSLKKDFNLKIGSTTGFTKVMVDVLLRDAKKQGYEPDFSCAGDEVENNMGFRPTPFMVYKNMVNLGVWPIDSVLKVDDTVSGVGEGLSAGCWTVGLAALSNYTNVDSNEEWDAMSQTEKNERIEASRNILFGCGAHYVADYITDLPAIVTDINKRLLAGERP
eukprot:UN25181